MDCVVSGGEPSTARFAGMLMGELYGGWGLAERALLVGCMLV